MAAQTSLFLGRGEFESLRASGHLHASDAAKPLSKSISPITFNQSKLPLILISAKYDLVIGLGK